MKTSEIVRYIRSTGLRAVVSDFHSGDVTKDGINDHIIKIYKEKKLIGIVVNIKSIIILSVGTVNNKIACYTIINSIISLDKYLSESEDEISKDFFNLSFFSHRDDAIGSNSVKVIKSLNMMVNTCLGFDRLSIPKSVDDYQKLSIIRTHRRINE